MTAPLLVFTQTWAGRGGTFVRTRASNAVPAAGAALVSGMFAIPASGVGAGVAFGLLLYTLTEPLVAELVPTTRKSVAFQRAVVIVTVSPLVALVTLAVWAEVPSVLIARTENW